MTKNALASHPDEPLTIIADPGAAVENIGRFARSRGFEVIDTIDNGSHLLTIHKLPEAMKGSASSETSFPDLLIASDRLGDGSPELGKLLMKNLIITLLETPKYPGRIFLINSGVLLAIEGSELVAPFAALANRGVEICSCGVCLDYYSVRERLAVGSVTNMYTIAEAMATQAGIMKL
jgi:selenium metabolism protein YedF